MSGGDLILNQATSQLDRVLQAPHPESVRVDGRNLAQLLAFAARFGPLVQFWDLSDHRDGNWYTFFAADPAVAHALHGALDLPEIETGLRALLHDCRHARSPQQRHQLLQQLQELLLRLVTVLDHALEDEGPLHPRWCRLLASPRRDPLAGPLQELHLHGAGQASPAWQECALDWLDGFLHLLEHLISALIETLRQGASAALLAAETSVSQRGHAPQAALYNAFALLFAESRDELNRFPRRLLDFYQDQILQQRQVAAEPDHVFLTCTLAQGASQADIPRANLFSAGTDALGQAIDYAADSALEVGLASVTGLRIHRVIYAFDAAPIGVLSGVVAEPGMQMQDFPLLGRNTPGRFGALTVAPASLGFAVASPTLMLSGGQRSVRIVLTPSSTPLLASRTSLAQTAGQVFALYYSSAGAWVAVQGARFSAPDDTSDTFELAFDLPPDAPPLVALSTPAAGPPPPPADTFPVPGEQPAVVAQLLPAAMDPATGGSAYQLLSLLELATVTLHVGVQQLPPAALHAPRQTLDPQQTMTLLGLDPVQYEGLQIQAPELFVKTLSSLSVSITWVGLPVTSKGFLGYYQGYCLDPDGQVSDTPLFDNPSFQVSFSLNSPGLWTVDSATNVCLFQTDAGACQPACTLLQTSLLPVPGLSPQAAPPYYDPGASALRMTLVQPNYAFGRTLYASNLSAASSANVAALRAGSQSGSTVAASASAPLANAVQVNASAPDHRHAKQVGAALQQAIAGLNGQALAALQQAVQQSTASPEQQAAHLQDLNRTISSRPAPTGPWWRGPWARAPDADSITSQLKTWAQAHESELAGGALAQALTVLESATGLSGAAAAALECAVAVARPAIDAALRQARQDLAQADVQRIQANTAERQRPMPNAPWLPQASAITLNYTALSTVALLELVDGDVVTPAQFLHLCPFLQLRNAPGQNHGVALLPAVANEAALYIDLSAPTDGVSLLFILKTDPEVWSDDEPQLVWEQEQDGAWIGLTLLGDSTHGLLNSGIVSLQLLPVDDLPPLLRVRLLRGADNMPLVSSVSANALSATWVGPGAAAQLGQPLPAGSITQSVNTIDGLGSIRQPMVSLGGRPQLTGDSFDLWMAERLRHKGYASTGWDYARLSLAAIPTLWQLAVVSATDASTGAPAPGKVWVIAVAGPGTPNIADPTTPMVDASVLGEIHGLLSQVASPFADIQVSNPPYVRLTVQANVIFSDADTVDHWLMRLQAELVRWLSPWPDASLGARPPDYYSRDGVAEFIRRRAYVRGINKIALRPDSRPEGPHYFTSAAQHRLSGSQGRSA